MSSRVAPGVTLEAERTRRGVFVCYFGTSQALIDARICTAAMLKPPRAPAAETRGVDGRGYSFEVWFDFSKVVIAWHRLPLREALQMPGVRDALAANDQERSASVPRSPRLRLAVDNTREDASRQPSSVVERIGAATPPSESRSPRRPFLVLAWSRP